MKVLLINGSPHKNGCTFTALSEIAKTLQECGVDSEIFHIGAAPIRGCMGCGGCAGKGKCIYEDTVNTAIEKAAEADGFIFGSLFITLPRAEALPPSWIACSMPGKAVWFTSPAPPWQAAAAPDPLPRWIS